MLLKRLLLTTAVTLLLSVTSVAQQSTPTPDPIAEPAPSPEPELLRRRFAPSLGGPTGLFTVYDGKTLQKRDFTFSFAYSNFDRDPGNVDITEVPVSFNYGLTDRVELFFTATIYRGVKVNNPQNSSSFYLPNSQLFFGQNLLGSGAALVLAPINNRGFTGVLFRPVNNQPFVQFPFVGQPSGTFGIGGSPPFSGTLGVQNTGGGNLGAAGNFPGIGSIFGSIFPGIVFSTNSAGGVITPAASTLAPSYLPDAPFVNRLYGESTFNTSTVGAKIRFTERESRRNFGIIPFYRFYYDKANDRSGFNMLQRGAGPGSNRGDFGLIGFFGYRFLTSPINLSANLGYVLNSNPTSKAFGSQRVTLLDRPDELLYGAGVDFILKEPWNQVIQPIIEVKGTKYVGGRTPNVFQNSPVDLILGARFYLPLQSKIPKELQDPQNPQSGSFFDNIGLGIAYRAHLNQQRGSGGVTPEGQVLSSSDPHGFLVQLWIGRDRYEATEGSKEISERILLQSGNQNLTELVLPCGPGFQPASGSCPVPNKRPIATAVFKDQNRKVLKKGELAPIKWEATPGTNVIPNEGETVTWDLSNVQKAGFYELRATTTYKNGKPKTIKFTLPVKECDCVAIPPITTTTPTPVCPTSLTVDSSPTVVEGTPAKFTASVIELPADTAFSYQWSVSAGNIMSRNDTPSISVDTTGLGGQVITATVTLQGLDARCTNTAQGDVTTARREITVDLIPTCKLFDRYGAVAYNDEKARLDNYVIALSEDRLLVGYIVAYNGGTLGRNIGTRRVPARKDFVDGQYRIDRATRYVRESRQFTGSIESVVGGDLNESTVELYVCPVNAPRPRPAPDPNIRITNTATSKIKQLPTERRLTRKRVRAGTRKHIVGS